MSSFYHISYVPTFFLHRFTPPTAHTYRTMAAAAPIVLLEQPYHPPLPPIDPFLPPLSDAFAACLKWTEDTQLNERSFEDDMWLGAACWRPLLTQHRFLRWRRSNCRQNNIIFKLWRFNQFNTHFCVLQPYLSPQPNQTKMLLWRHNKYYFLCRYESRKHFSWNCLVIAISLQQVWQIGIGIGNRLTKMWVLSDHRPWWILAFRAERENRNIFWTRDCREDTFGLDPLAKNLL